MECYNVKLFLFSLCLVCSLCEELTVPCDVKDISCLRKSTQNFLEKTSLGIPNLDIKAIDPMVIESFNDTLCGRLGIKHYLHDVTVLGFKEQQVADFKMNLEDKSVFLMVTADLRFTGHLMVEYTKQQKTFDLGNYTASGSVVIETTYPYSLRTSDKGVEHFEVGKEDIKCEATNVPTYTINPSAIELLQNESAIAATRADFLTHKDDLMKKTLCRLASEAYHTVVHNIRASGRILPKTAYFTNL